MYKKKVHMKQIEGLNYDAFGHVIKDSAYFSHLGRLGGLKTKQRLKDDPFYYQRNGLIGGQKLLKERGKAFYSRIGKMSKRVPKEEQS